MQPTSYINDSYSGGVSFRVIPRTSLNYDQFFTFFKGDTTAQLAPASSAAWLWSSDVHACQRAHLSVSDFPFNSPGRIPMRTRRCWRPARQIRPAMAYQLYAVWPCSQYYPTDSFRSKRLLASCRYSSAESSTPMPVRLMPNFAFDVRRSRKPHRDGHPKHRCASGRWSDSHSRLSLTTDLGCNRSSDRQTSVSSISFATTTFAFPETGFT